MTDAERQVAIAKGFIWSLNDEKQGIEKALQQKADRRAILEAELEGLQSEIIEGAKRHAAITTEIKDLEGMIEGTEGRPEA